MARIQAIIFDKDGTLFDFQSTWAGWARRLLGDLAEGDAASMAAMGAAIGFDPVGEGRFTPGSPAVAGTAGEMADILLAYTDRITRSELVARIDDAAMSVELAPAVPLAAFLDGLSARGIGLGVVTNDSERPARAHLSASGIIDRFGAVLGYDSGFGAKPGPGPVLAALDILGVAPDAALMVGDSRHDLIAGRAAGTGTLGVLTGLAEAADLQPFADAILPDVGHIPDWLDQMGGT